MKKSVLAITLTAILMLLSLAAGATDVDFSLEGLITEVTDEGFVMTDNDLGEVQVNLADDTAYEGVDARDTLAVGQYVYVQYNGQMTRSLPPQVSAQKVSCFKVAGIVSEIMDNGYIVEGDETVGTVIVRGGEHQPTVYVGMHVTVYYNGVMAMSYPGQIGAAHIVVPCVTGDVSEVAEDHLTLTLDDGSEQIVLIDENTRRLGLATVGESVTALYGGTANEDGSITALEIGLTIDPTAEEEPLVQQ